MAGSARGLFRATGKSAIVKASRPLLEREAEDFYPTPPEPTLALCRAESERLSAFPLIWEPACGDGAMARDLARCGHLTVCSDVIDRGCGAELRDFFDYDQPLAPAIVTNPPYHAINWRDGKGRWIPHAIERLGVRYMALLLSWSWPGAGGLGSIWAKHPPARVYLMRWKIDFTGAGAPPMLNGWFVWDAEWQGETVLRMLDRNDDPRQAALFAGAA